MVKERGIWKELTRISAAIVLVLSARDKEGVFRNFLRIKDKINMGEMVLGSWNMI